MKRVVTKAVVLARTNFQEADRIITVLTPDQGKVSLMVRGARRAKSKLAGGIELFSVSDITYLPGRKEVCTLISSRLVEHYGNIAKDIDRTMLGYDILKRINRITEDAADSDYFDVLQATLAGLNNVELSPELTELWLTMQLLKITGHSPNLKTDVQGRTLHKVGEYLFDYGEMAFKLQKGAPYTANHIKLLRLGIGTTEPEELLKVQGAEKQSAEALQLAKAFLQRSTGI